MSGQQQEQLGSEGTGPPVGVDPSLSETMVRICATSPTGLQQIAADEVKEKLNVTPDVTRGKIFFHIPLKSMKELKQLCSVDNLSVVVWHQDSMNFVKKDKEDVMAELETLTQPSSLNWREGLVAWQFFTDSTVDIDYCQPVNTEDSNESGSGDKSSEAVPSDIKNTNEQSADSGVTPADGVETPGRVPKFRVTCNRVGTNHTFTSMEAASHFGGCFNDHFGWTVTMKQFDVNILVNIVDNAMTISLALTDLSLHRRYLTNFGPTTLRSTIAYSLLRLSNIQPGDVICDPMCGSGSIPIEACMNWPSCLTLCGDNHDVGCEKTYGNIEGLLVDETLRGGRGRPNLDVLQWDATNLPLPTNMVDVIASDLPFGKRMGSKFNNRILYPKLLREMGRVCKPKTGRATLMTQDLKSIKVALSKCSSMWSHRRTVWVNVGGLSVGVFILTRTKYQPDNDPGQ